MPEPTPPPDSAPIARIAAGGPGTWCGPYRLVGELGRGGAGVVWRAWDSRHEREVALKVLTSTSAEARARFEREAKVLAALHHPNLCPLLDCGTWNERPFFVMPFVPGETLAEIARGGTLDPREAARIVRDAAQGVAHAHVRGVLHRDLKPHNVLVDETGQVKVLDFGVARLADPGVDQLTRTNHVVGTVAFMPPEQLDPRRGPVDARSDVWALGATLHAAITGSSPFSGSTQLTQAILEDEPVPPSGRRPGIPPALDAIALRCLRKDPRERYADAGRVADDLDRFLRGVRPEALGAPPRARSIVPLTAGATVLAAAAVSLFLVLSRPTTPIHPIEPTLPPPPPPVERPQLAEAAAVLSRAASAPEGEPEEPAVEELARLGVDGPLLARIEETWRLLDAAYRERLVAVGEPTAEEAAQGWGALPGIADALDARNARAARAAVPPAAEDVLGPAGARLVARHGARVLLEVADEQAGRVGPEGLRATRIACRALGRMGAAPGRAAALGRLLRAELHPERAVPIGQALLDLGAAGDWTAIDYLHEARTRWTGPWAKEVLPTLKALEDRLPDPPAAKDLLRRAELRFGRGEVLAAREDAAAALELDPGQAQAHNWMGNVLAVEGKLAEAIAAFDRAVELEPKSPGHRMNRAVMRLHSDPAAAVEDLTGALGLENENEGELLRTLALAHEGAGDLDAAVECYRKALELRPGMIESLHELGELLAKRGEHEEADELFTRTLARHPTRAKTLSERASARARLGRLKEARDDLVRACRIEPRAPLLWLNLGSVLAALKDPASARAAWTRAAELDPKGTIGAAAKKELEKPR